MSAVIHEAFWWIHIFMKSDSFSWDYPVIPSQMSWELLLHRRCSCNRRHMSTITCYGMVQVFGSQNDDHPDVFRILRGNSMNFEIRKINLNFCDRRHFWSLFSFICSNQCAPTGRVTMAFTIRDENINLDQLQSCWCLFALTGTYASSPQQDIVLCGNYFPLLVWYLLF